MFDSGILDVVIGVVVVYLQLSLVCTAVNELVALWLKKRAKELEKGILGLLTKPELVDKLYEHPLIKGLRPDGRKPSYIPSRTFSLALMDIIRRHSFVGTVSAATQDVASKTAVRDAAKIALDTATASLTAAQTVNQAANDALASAGAANQLQASKDAQEAANNEATAKAASETAKAKFDAAELALNEATTYQTNVTRDAAAAQQAETAAQTAEATAKADPKNENLKAAAKAARASANTAADALAPSASSLLTEARDKVAGVQNDVVPPELKTALLALMDNAGTNLNKAQANVEQWFDDAMDRVSGVYKRKSHVFVVTIAVLVTVLANVDTLQVADALSHDKALRQTLVAAAPELAKADKDLVNKERGINPDGSSAASTPTPTPTPVVGADSSPATNPGAAATPGPTPAPTALPTPSLSTIKASIDELKKFGLPIGYIRVCTPVEEKTVEICANAAEALVADTEARLKEAEAKSQKAKDDFKTATDNHSKETKDSKATQESIAATQEALSKADADRAKPLEDLKKAQDAHTDAVDRADKVKRIRTERLTAEADLQADPQNPAKQKTAENARSKAALTTECPKCSKKSELSPGELKRRLPTTHDYNIWSFKGFCPAVWALVKDSWELLYAHWLGWALTAFAVSLGAPFWFDMLNKLIVVRSTVKPHEKSKEQESKDNPDETDETKKT